MIIQRQADLDGNTRKEYISTKQGAAPPGWKCVAVCGYHEEPRENNRNNYNSENE
jgi:hypothetical protein